LIDTYKTIAAPTIGEFKDRGSKFIAYAFPAATEQAWHEHLEAVKKLHPKARHHCFAFRMGTTGNQYRANDDGEPAGSAGRPILGQIDSFGLTDVIVIVVRYFGGTLLGVPGLIAAYKGSTQEALQQASVVEKYIRAFWQLQVDYAQMSDVMNAVKKLAFEVIDQQFNDTGTSLTVAVRQGEADRKILEFKALAGGLHLEEAMQVEQLPGIQIEPMYVS
jgi:uncharacterized YigZ family protein